MELIYSTQSTGFEPHKHYRNPLYFEKAERQASKVHLLGDFPQITQAYQAIGVEVTVADKPKSDKGSQGNKPKGAKNDPEHS